MDNKNKRFLYFQMIGFGVCALLGSLLHFVYEWSGKSPFVALFSAINESTFEHMKLLFFPCFAFAIVESFFFKERTDFWCIKLKGILLGLVLIPVTFYTFNGAIATSPDFINILIFFICLGVTFLHETLKYNKGNLNAKFCTPKLAFLGLCLIAIGFFTFTFLPLDIGLFEVP